MKRLFLKMWVEWREIVRESAVPEDRSLELLSPLGLEGKRRESFMDHPTGVVKICLSLSLQPLLYSQFN